MVSVPYTNADGLVEKFPNYYKDPEYKINRPRAVVTNGAIKQIVIDVDLTKIANTAVTYTSDLNNDGTLDGFNDGDCYLPANSNILRAFYYVTEAAAGGTSIAIGTFGKTGTAIDADFFLNTTDGAKAKLDTLGACITARGVGLVDLAIDGDGAVTTVEKAGVGTADAYIAITGAGTWTAGKGIFVIEYITNVDA